MDKYEIHCLAKKCVDAAFSQLKKAPTEATYEWAGQKVCEILEATNDFCPECGCNKYFTYKDGTAFCHNITCRHKWQKDFLGQIGVGSNY